MAIGFFLFFYIFVYRRFAPKAIMNSAVYHQTVEYLQKDPKLTAKVGDSFRVMNCNGKIWPLF